MTQSEVPTDIQELILRLKEQMYSKGSIVREVKKRTHDKEKAKEYVDIVLTGRKQVYDANPGLYRQKAKSLLAFGVAFIVIPTILVLIFPNFLTLRLGIIIGPIYLLLALFNYLRSLRRA